MKRMFDVLFSIITIVSLFPLWALATGIILFSDPGPILFRQRRVGLDEAEFDILKFRTMVTKQKSIGTVTVRDDPRIIFGVGFKKIQN